MDALVIYPIEPRIAQALNISNHPKEGAAVTKSREVFGRAEAKITWASRKTDEVEQRANAYFSSSPISLTPEVGRRSVDLIANVALALPAELSLLVGEWAHSLRSALDHVVYGHVDDPAAQETCAFPSWRKEAPPTPQQWSRRVQSSVPGLRAEPLRSAIEALQPYRGGEDEWLWTLTELDNIDKHRVPLAVAAAVAATRSVSQGHFITDSRASVVDLDQDLLYELTMDPPPSHPFIKNPTVADMLTDVRLEIVYSDPEPRVVTDGCPLYTFRRHEWHDIIEVRPTALSLVFGAGPLDGHQVLDEMRTMTSNVQEALGRLRDAAQGP